MPGTIARHVTRMGSIEIPRKVTGASPIVFTLRLYHPGMFSFDISARITFAAIGRDMICTVRRDGPAAVKLTYRIGPRKSWWMMESKNDRDVVEALRSALALAGVMCA